MIYCSFANEEGWLGAVYVPGFNLTHSQEHVEQDKATIIDVTLEMRRRGVNPGGEVLFFNVPPEVQEHVPQADHWQLLDLEGVNRIDALCEGEGVERIERP